MTSTAVRLAKLENPIDAGHVLRLLEHYSEHPMGAGQKLPESVSGAVLDGLREHPTTLVFLAERNKEVVGMATCFVGFSTFKAKPLVNIHDLVVHQHARGQGVGSALIEAVKEHAKAQRWCAVTLEVLSCNPARRLYASKGFQGLDEPVSDQTMLFGKLVL